MIDLHSHILPGLDDGSPDLATSLEMARLAVADGIVVMACTPHAMPGVYDNKAPAILGAIEVLRNAIEVEGIPLRLVAGSDIHVTPGLARALADRDVLSLNGTRYFLLEPPHHVLPPRLDEFAFGLLAAGFVPILTHPERLGWIENHAGVIDRLCNAGVLLQITAGSLTGRFGPRPLYWAERLLGEGRTHLLATDAHDARRRPPFLAEARVAAAKRVGEAEAERLVVSNPLNILENVLPSDLQPAARGGVRERQGFWQRIWPSGSGRKGRTGP